MDFFVTKALPKLYIQKQARDELFQSQDKFSLFGCIKRKLKKKLCGKKIKPEENVGQQINLRGENCLAQKCQKKKFWQ